MNFGNLTPGSFPLTQAHRYCLSVRISWVGVPALNLSRRDRNRADLSSDK